MLVNLGWDRIAANTIATGSAFVFSFFMNRTFTFKAKQGNIKKQLFLFVIITLSGLWVIQPIIISLIPNLLIGKVIATGVTLVWNYIFYNKVVFKVHERKGNAED